MTREQARDLNERLIADEVKRGRPTIYCEELAVAILSRLAAGESLSSITRDEGMPTRACVHRWVMRFNDAAPADFGDRYREAIEVGAAAKFDELDEEALDLSHEVARSKLIVDTRKWVLARQFPKKYGDRHMHELETPEGGMNITVVTGVPGSPGSEVE